ncbi:MAG: divalent-cation tolerance protein CutA [Nitrosopumilus sp.]
MKPVMIISTYPNKKLITKIANEFLKNKIIACVNISKISSIYSWNGKVENTSEYLAIFKTISKNKKLLKQKIKETHPYDIPEIAEIDVVSLNKLYLSWLIDSTN